MDVCVAEPSLKEGTMHKNELHGFVVKLCSDEQLDAVIAKHQAAQRCGRCNQPLGELLVRHGKTIHYDCN